MTAAPDRPRTGNKHTARPAIERLFEYLVLSETGCWLFEGDIDQYGYGRIQLSPTRDGRRGRGRCHRVTYEHFREAIPPDLQIDHLCRVRHCANPWHMEVVTSAENTRRGNSPGMVRHRTGLCKRGHSLDLHGMKHGNGRKCRICHNASTRRQRANPSDIYLEHGEPVRVLVRWTGHGPRNALIERADGSRVVRPFRGLRRIRPIVNPV